MISAMELDDSMTHTKPPNDTWGVATKKPTRISYRVTDPSSCVNFRKIYPAYRFSVLPDICYLLGLCIQTFGLVDLVGLVDILLSRNLSSIPPTSKGAQIYDTL